MKTLSNILLTILSAFFGLTLLVFFQIGVKIEEQQQIVSSQNTNVVEIYNRFDTIMKYTLSWEGGFQNYPTDSGNYSTDSVLCGTKYGISAIAYQDYFGNVTPNAMYYLDTATAEIIYLEKFYNPTRINKIDNHAVAHLIFDTYIAGPSTCRRILSEILQQKVKIPFSDEIILKINKIEPNYLFQQIWDLRYAHIVNRSVKYPEFKDGWTNRLNKIKNLYYE